jgi:hypothetical protein
MYLVGHSLLRSTVHMIYASNDMERLTLVLVRKVVIECAADA